MLPSLISPQSGMGWLSPPQGFQAVRRAMGSPWCEAYNSCTDLQQSLQTRPGHPDCCLPALRQAVRSTAQRSAQTCAHQPVAVTEIKGFNSPGCLFISRARDVGDLCIWAAEVGTHFGSQRQRRGVSPPFHWGYSVLQLSWFPAQLPPCQTGISPTHQQPAKPARHPRARDVSPRRCTDAPPGHSPEGDGVRLGWPGLALEHCWCWLSWVFLVLSGSSRLDTPPGDLPYGKDFVRDFAEAHFGENLLCLTSLQFIWLRRHRLVLDCASSPLPSMPLAFSVKKNSNSTSRPPEK